MKITHVKNVGYITCTHVARSRDGATRTLGIISRPRHAHTQHILHVPRSIWPPSHTALITHEVTEATKDQTGPGDEM